MSADAYILLYVLPERKSIPLSVETQLGVRAPVAPPLSFLHNPAAVLERFSRFFSIRRRAWAQREVIRSLSEAIDQSYSAVMITDLESRIQYANGGLCNQMGYSREELIGRNWRDFQQKETPPELLADLVATVRAGRPWRNEWFNRRKNGELYPVRGCVSPINDAHGHLACFLAIFEDMTEVKRSEMTLREALARAAEGDRSKSRFLATMSHEMKTPLNGIAGFTSLLRGTALTPEQEEYVESIRASGEALIQLTDDILELARIEGGKLKLEPVVCDVRQCLEDVLDGMAVRAADKGLELLHWVDEGVPPTLLLDELRLRQVLVSLVGNAVKFTGRGEVEVALHASRSQWEAPGGWKLTFAVRDTGIGIADADLDKLFKPFSQLDESTTRRFSGTGLGLAISKNVVQLMGGEIAIESEPGRGSTFSFWIPAGSEPHAPHAPPDLRNRRAALAARAGPFRREFARLARRWRLALIEVDAIEDLPADGLDFVFVEVDADLARAFAAGAPRLPAGYCAIVSASLSQALRAGLRGHFQLVLNKPLHHEALLCLLSTGR